MVMDVNLPSCGDHFTIHANISSLHRTPETNQVICQAIKKNSKIKKIK